MTIKLEGFTIDILQAFNEVKSAKEIYKCEIEQKFYIIYEHTVLMAEIVNVQPYIPRICFRADEPLNDLEPESNRTDKLKAIAWEILQSYSSKMYV